MHDLIKYTALSGYANTLIYENEDLDINRKEFMYLRWIYVLEDKGKYGVNYWGLQSSIGHQRLTVAKWVKILINKGLLYKVRNNTFSNGSGFSAYYRLTTKGRTLLFNCYQYLHEHEEERIKKLARPKSAQKNPIN